MQQKVIKALLFLSILLLSLAGMQLFCSAAEKGNLGSSSAKGHLVSEEGQTATSPDQHVSGHKHASQDLVGVLEDSQVPVAVVRDSALKKILTGKADAEHNHDKTYAGSADLEALKKRISTLETGLTTYTEKLEKKIAIQEAEIDRLMKLLADVSRSGSDMVFKGINIQIVNGTGATDGVVNGRGNLIIGYNETRGQDGQDSRVGSHNIVVGQKHNYSSYGGLMVGAFHTVSAPYSSVSGGYGNIAEGSYSTVAGGQLNKASGKYATVTGGMTRSASDNNNWQGGKFFSER